VQRLAGLFEDFRESVQIVGFRVGKSFRSDPRLQSFFDNLLGVKAENLLGEIL
jgi:hypothetical protein